MISLVIIQDPKNKKWTFHCQNIVARWMKKQHMYEWLHCCWTHRFESPLHSDIKGPLHIRMLWCLSMVTLRTLHSFEWAEQKCIQIWLQSKIYVWISQPTTSTVKSFNVFKLSGVASKAFHIHTTYIYCLSSHLGMIFCYP